VSCRLLGTYFEASQEELALFKYVTYLILIISNISIFCVTEFYHYSVCVSLLLAACCCRVERFSEEMNQLLEITLRSRLVEKLCVAMYSGIFEEHADDDEEEVGGERECCIRWINNDNSLTSLNVTFRHV
jgi:hypothetical protein